MEKKRKKQISPRQAKAVTFLVLGKTQKDVARLVGVTEKTMGNWMKNSVFLASVKKAYLSYREMRFIASTAIEDQAIAALTSIMLDENSSPGERIRAAKALLDNFCKNTGDGQLFSEAIGVEEKEHHAYEKGKLEAIEEKGREAVLGSALLKDDLLANWDRNFSHLIE